MKVNQKAALFTPFLCSLLLSACGGSSGSGDGSGEPMNTPSGLTERTIDASAGGIGASTSDPKNRFAYFNFASGRVVDLADAAAATDAGWDIAFKRTSIKLNGGASGSGSVQGTVADKQEDFYAADGTTPNASVFTNATPAMEINAINAVTADTGLTYTQDRHIPAITGDGGSDSWWRYDPTARTVSANPNAWHIVRSAGGNSYAKIHVTNIVQASREISVEMLIQDASNMAFATTPVMWTAAIGAVGGSKCYDFDSTAEVDCTAAAATWDIQLEVSSGGRAWHMWTNSGIRGNSRSGGAFGTLTPISVNDFASGGQVTFYTADSSSGVFTDANWYAYNLQGNRHLWPNYRVYVIDTGSAKYKLQITSYYDPSTGSSGALSIRYVAL